MRIAVVDTCNDPKTELEGYQRQGFITFMYHYVDPDHELLADKFLYVHDEDELKEKVNLLMTDVSAQDLLYR